MTKSGEARTAVLRMTSMPVLVTLALLLLLVIGSMALAATRAAGEASGARDTPGTTVVERQDSGVVEVILGPA